MEQDNQLKLEISLKELLYVILKKRRPIILTAFILAALLGGFKVAAGLISARDTVTSEKSMEEYESKLVSYRLQKEASEKQLSVSQNLLETETERMDTSPIMQLDPATAISMTYGMQVTANRSSFPGILEDDTDRIQRIIGGYVEQLSDDIMEEAASKLGMDASELASITEIRSDEYSRKFYIDVYAATEAKARKILDTFSILLGDYQDSISEEYGEHELTQISERINKDANQKIVDRQLALINTVTDLRNKLTDLEKNIDNLKTGEPKAPAISKTAILKSGVKYGILGFVLGGFMAVFFVCVAFLMSDKVTNLRDVAQRYGLKELGELSQSSQKKKFLSCIDHWIDRLFGIAPALSENEAYQLIAANVKNYLSENAKKILVTGSVSTADAEKLAEQLSVFVHDVTFTAASDLASNPEALKMLPECDAVILAEARGKATTNSIEAELSIIRNTNKLVVGIILN